MGMNLSYLLKFKVTEIYIKILNEFNYLDNDISDLYRFYDWFSSSTLPHLNRDIFLIIFGQ